MNYNQCDKPMTSLLNSPVIHCLEKAKCLFQTEQFKKNHDVSVHEKNNLFQCEYCKRGFHNRKITVKALNDYGKGDTWVSK